MYEGGGGGGGGAVWFWCAGCAWEVEKVLAAGDGFFDGKVGGRACGGKAWDGVGR